jgi:hypothetical protein
MKSYYYRGASLPGKCPNRCFERLVDQGICQNKIDGVEPKTLTFDGLRGYTSLHFHRWSKKLKRHTRRTNGHYIMLEWSHCPHCGQPLT